MAGSAVQASVSIGTRMLLHWGDIAVERELLAWAARRALESDVKEAKASGKALELGRELHPSLIAIAAASHALDALYGEIRDLALPPEIAAKWKDDPRSGPSRPLKLHEALKHGSRSPLSNGKPSLRPSLSSATEPFIPSSCSESPSRIRWA